MRAVIGVTPLWDETKRSVWMLPGYLDVIREAGGIPIILPLEIEREDLEQLCGMCDGFLLTGGDDVDPALYGQEPQAECGATNPRRDALERAIFDYAMLHDLPLLGICRGIQLINALCGGSLYQDLPSQRGVVGGVRHQMTPPYDRAIHEVLVVEDSPLWEIVKGERLGVNSYHHQAIERLAPGVEAMALSEDGLVEALYLPAKSFVQGYQWHPEFSYLVDPISQEIVNRFIAAATPQR